MPRNGAGVYSLPAGSLAVSNTTIESSKQNAYLNDLVTDANTARPLAYGGTGGTSQITGWDGLTAKGTDIASNATINLTTATGPRIDITGTTTITAVTLAAGSIRIARATGIFQITASASLVVNKSTSVNYTTAVGDLLIFIADSTVVSVTAIGSGGTAATTSAAGIVELATLAETLAGTDTSRAVVPANLYFPTGHLYGLTLSNNGTDATNDIDIAAGTARDGSDSYNMILASALTKRLDAAWAVGTGNGGLDTGSIANTTYHVWLIKRSDTGVVDALFSTSASSPTMPTNYDTKRRIGSIIRSGATILAFTQRGNDFQLSTPVLDYNADLSTTASTITLGSVPTGVVVVANFNAYLDDNAAYVYFSSLTAVDLAPSSTAAPLSSMGTNSGTDFNLASFRPLSITTNTSAQFRGRANAAAVTLRIATLGWTDPRGQN